MGETASTRRADAKQWAQLSNAQRENREEVYPNLNMQLNHSSFLLLNSGLMHCRYLLRGRPGRCCFLGANSVIATCIWAIRCVALHRNSIFCIESVQVDSISNWWMRNSYNSSKSVTQGCCCEYYFFRQLIPSWHYLQYVISNLHDSRL